MPTYVLECLKCHHRFEEFEGFGSALDFKCPICGGKAAIIIQPITFIVYSHTPQNPDWYSEEDAY